MTVIARMVASAWKVFQDREVARPEDARRPALVAAAAGPAVAGEEPAALSHLHVEAEGLVVPAARASAYVDPVWGHPLRGLGEGEGLEDVAAALDRRHLTEHRSTAQVVEATALRGAQVDGVRRKPLRILDPIAVPQRDGPGLRLGAPRGQPRAPGCPQGDLERSQVRARAGRLDPEGDEVLRRARRPAQTVQHRAARIGSEHG